MHEVPLVESPCTVIEATKAPEVGRRAPTEVKLPTINKPNSKECSQTDHADGQTIKSPMYPAVVVVVI